MRLVSAPTPTPISVPPPVIPATATSPYSFEAFDSVIALISILVSPTAEVMFPLALLLPASTSANLALKIALALAPFPLLLDVYTSFSRFSALFYFS